jgi:hypothetical protein
MSKQCLSRLSLLPLATMAAVLLPARCIGAEPNLEAAQLALYAHPEGVSYFALALRAKAPKQADTTRDLVVLVNTSAEQTGVHRERALAALDALLANLGQDRVDLMSFDRNTISLTKGFVSPNSPDMSRALARLQRREPLGDTDLETAFNAAAVSYEGSPTTTGAIVFIGDGLSRAKPLGPEKLERLVKVLTEKKVAVTSYLVGAVVDAHVLSAMAASTGGMIYREAAMAPDEAGKNLASAVRGSVVWPKYVQWPAAFTEVLPRQAPPLRADRDSVVIGTLKGLGPFEIQVTTDGGQVLTWRVAAVESKDDNSYLARLVTLARPQGGLNLPLVEWDGLKQAEQILNASGRPE